MAGPLEDVPSGWEVVDSGLSTVGNDVPNGWEVVDSQSPMTEITVGLNKPETSDAYKTLGAAKGWLSALGQGATLGFGDELSSSLAALPYALPFYRPDVGYWDARDQLLAQERADIKDFQKDYPYQSAGANVLGAVAPVLFNPAALAAAAPEGATAIGNAARSVGTGIGLGAAGGYGAGEGSVSDRADKALEGGLFGAAFGALAPGLGAVARGGRYLAERAPGAFRRAALGIKQADLAKALRTGAGVTERLQTGENPVVNAVDNLTQLGELGNEFNPEVLYNQSFDRVADLSKNVRGVLNEADNAVQTANLRALQGYQGAQPIAQVFEPKWDNARRFVAKLHGTDEQAAQYIENEIARYESEVLDGTVNTLQDVKTALGSRAYGQGSPHNKLADRAITADLNKTIQEGVGALESQGLLPKGSLSAVKKNNNQMGDWLALRDVFARAENAGENKSIGELLRDRLRTSGGTLTTPVIIGGIAAGHPVAAALSAGALTAATNPTAQWQIARGLDAIAPALGPVSRGAEAVFDSPLVAQTLTRARENIYGGKEEKKKESKPSKVKQEKTVDASLFQPSSLPVSSDGINWDQVLNAVRRIESADGKYLKSKAGALGPYQIMPATARLYGVTDIKDLYDEAKSRALARKILEDEYGALGNLDDALRAYNAGRPKVMAVRAGEATYKPETIDYLPKFYAALKALQGAA